MISCSIVRRVLITGGAGFIGSHLVSALSRLDTCEIVVIDNMSNSSTPAWQDEHKIRFYKEDILNKEAVSKIVREEKIETCVHLAAKISVSESMQYPEKVMDTNVKGTLGLLEACSANNTKNFILASSAAVYGDSHLLPLSEGCAVNPQSPYGASKVAAEAFVMSYKLCGKIQSAIALRFFNVYGQGQSSEYAGVITKFTERISKGLPLMIFGDGSQTRDFVSVQDVVRSLILSMDSNLSEVFNVGTGRPVSINEVASGMLQAAGLDLQPVHAPKKDGDIVHSYADIRKARDRLGFVAVRDIRSDLKEMIRNIRN